MTSPALEPSFALVVACCTLPASDAGDAALRRRAAQADWPEFVALGRRHRVLALVGHSLRRAAVAVPEPWRSALDEAMKTAERAELASIAEASRLARLLAQNGIDARILKGVAVSLAAFGRLGLRQNHDIDLLIAAPAIDRATALLVEAGYTLVEPAPNLEAAALRRWRRSRKDAVFFHHGMGFLLELHWRLFDNPNLLPVPQHAGEDEPIAPFAPGLRTLPRAFNLCYLCVHGAQHAWSRLKWLVDIHAIVSRLSEAELAEAVALANAQGVGRAVAQALVLRERIFGVAVAPSLRAQLMDDGPTRMLVDLALRCLLGGGSAEIEAQPFATTLKNVSHYLLRRDIRYRSAELWFDAMDGRANTLPPSLWWLAPLVRPLSWIVSQATRGSAAAQNERPPR